MGWFAFKFPILLSLEYCKFVICFGEQSQCVSTRSCIPVFGVEMLRCSTLMRCFIGSGQEKNKLNSIKSNL